MLDRERPRGLSVWPLGARDPGPGVRYRDPASHEFDSSGSRGGVQVQPSRALAGCLAQLTVRPAASSRGGGEGREPTGHIAGTVACW
jgi:hypothetical protein